MNATKSLIYSFLLLLAFSACQSKKNNSKSEIEKRTQIEMVSDLGTIVFELYNETPLHRNNFIKIVQEGVLDSVLFHRVIENFMIQAGDPDSKNAQPGKQLGNGGLDYRVDAEFCAQLFHKKGALAAARDGNPERASSSTQFYIVQGKVFNDSLLNIAQARINTWLAENLAKNEPANKALAEALQKAMDNNNMQQYTLLNDSLQKIAKSYTFEHYTIPETHREVYKTLGGTPHLDQNYTVFGQVVKGMEVVDSIASVQTGEFDRPVHDIRIKSMRVLE